MKTQIHIITKCDKFLIRKTDTANDGSCIVTYMTPGGFYVSDYDKSARFDLQVEAESHYRYHSEEPVSLMFERLY